jgi:thiol:disulfide interchange protein
MSPARTAILALTCFALVGLWAAPAEAGSPAEPNPGSEPGSTPDPAASPLHWHPVGDEEVLADREGKPILYFFTADWCAPCHQMKRTLFADPEKVSRISEWFVPVEVQDVRAETGENPPAVDEAIERYRVMSLPTMVVALPDGRELGQHRGYAGEERAWRWLNQQAAMAEAKLDRE